MQVCSAFADRTVQDEKWQIVRADDAMRATPEISFDSPPDDLELMESEIHIFRTGLGVSPERMLQLAETLPADELGRAGRFHFESDRNRFVAGRGMLREILGWLLDSPPEDLVFSYGANGKPELAPTSSGLTALRNGQCLHFNLAYSGPLAVYAVSRGFEVGVDVERIRPMVEAGRWVAEFFSEFETARCCELPPDEQAEFFFECWTRKEACLKATGEGFSGLSEEIKDWREPGWFVHSLKPSPGYAVAVAAQNHVRRIVNWTW